MAAIFSYGLAVAIGLFVGLIFTIIGLFFGHIIFLTVFSSDCRNNLRSNSRRSYDAVSVYRLCII